MDKVSIGKSTSASSLSSSAGVFLDSVVGSGSLSSLEIRILSYDKDLKQKEKKKRFNQY